MRVGCTEPEGDTSKDGLLKSLAIPIPILRGDGRLCFGRVVVANAYSSDDFMSRLLYCTTFSHEIGSPCTGKGDWLDDKMTWR